MPGQLIIRRWYSCMAAFMLRGAGMSISYRTFLLMDLTFMPPASEDRGKATAAKNSSPGDWLNGENCCMNSPLQPDNLDAFSGPWLYVYHPRAVNTYIFPFNPLWQGKNERGSRRRATYMGEAPLTRRWLGRGRMGRSGNSSGTECQHRPPPRLLPVFRLSLLLDARP